MGCFSYICPHCGRGLECFSKKHPNGEPVRLFFLVDGEVVEKMAGIYDGYGRVSKSDEATHTVLKRDRTHPAKGWDDNAVEWEYAEWVHMVTMHFHDAKGDPDAPKDPFTGFAGCHMGCGEPDWVPTDISEDDPDQGWGC